MIPSPVLPKLTKNIFHHPTRATHSPGSQFQILATPKAAPALKATPLLLVFPISGFPPDICLCLPSLVQADAFEIHTEWFF